MSLNKVKLNQQYEDDIKEITKILKQKPLSDTDILEIEPTNIIFYENLRNYNRIDECFDRHHRFILFLPVKNKFDGHWTAVLRKNDNIEFYDPYGNRIQNIRTFLKSRIYFNHQDFLDLVENSGYNLVQNKYIHQNRNDMDNKACGRFSVMRLMFYKLNNEEYNKLLNKLKKNGISPLNLSIIATTNI